MRHRPSAFVAAGACIALFACAGAPQHDSKVELDVKTEKSVAALPIPETVAAEPAPAVVDARSQPEAAQSPPVDQADLGEVTRPKQVDPAAQADTLTVPVPVGPAATAATAVASKQEPSNASNIADDVPALTAPKLSNLRGVLKLTGNRGVTIAPGELAEAFVYYLPRSGGAKAVPGRFEIATRDKRFEPSSMVIPLGSTVKFPNLDVVLHNAFSVSPKNEFDLGIYGKDESREYTFGRPGLVLVHCNVHHSMQANVLVVDSPYSTRVQADGSFVLTGLPAGGGSLYLWHPRAVLQSRLVDVPADKPYVAELLVTKPRVPPHLNKLGQSYRAARAGATP